MMDTLVVALVVLAAGAYVARILLRAVRPPKDAGCASGCGCGDAAKGDASDWARTQ